MAKKLEVLGPVPEQKCKFCLRKGCTNPECSEEYMIRKKWNRELIGEKFRIMIYFEIQNFIDNIEKNNKFKRMRYMRWDYYSYEQEIYWVFSQQYVFNNHDDWDLDDLFYDYKIYKTGLL